jgi:hypothetical protein
MPLFEVTLTVEVVADSRDEAEDIADALGEGVGDHDAARSVISAVSG